MVVLRRFRSAVVAGRGVARLSCTGVESLRRLVGIERLAEFLLCGLRPLYAFAATHQRLPDPARPPCRTNRQGRTCGNTNANQLGSRIFDGTLLNDVEHGIDATGSLSQFDDLLVAP